MLARTLHQTLPPNPGSFLGLNPDEPRSQLPQSNTRAARLGQEVGLGACAEHWHAVHASTLPVCAWPGAKVRLRQVVRSKCPAICSADLCRPAARQPGQRAACSTALHVRLSSARRSRKAGSCCAGSMSGWSRWCAPMPPGDEGFGMAAGPWGAGGQQSEAVVLHDGLASGGSRMHACGWAVCGSRECRWEGCLHVCVPASCRLLASLLLQPQPSMPTNLSHHPLLPACSIASLVQQHGWGNGAQWLANWEAVWQANLDGCGPGPEGECLIS